MVVLVLNICALIGFGAFLSRAWESTRRTGINGCIWGTPSYVLLGPAWSLYSKTYPAVVARLYLYDADINQ